jgi:hypothetical protein
MKNRGIHVLIALVVMLATSCHPPERTYSSSSTFTPGPAIAELTEASVRVVASIEWDDQHRPILRATFTPLEAGFHLYGKDLPPTGIQGVGRPTRLDLPKQSSIRAVGPAFSDVVPHDLQFDAIGAALPIYPEGPVSIRLPVELRPADGGFIAQLAVSYMACQTNGQCRIPVTNKAIEARIPKL